MSDSPELNTDDLQDRLVDQMLGELVGKQTPPDLTDRVLVAADASRPIDGQVEFAARLASRRSTGRIFMVAASVALLLTAAVVAGLQTHWFGLRKPKVFVATAWVRIEEEKPYIAYRLDKEPEESKQSKLIDLTTMGRAKHAPRLSVGTETEPSGVVVGTQGIPPEFLQSDGIEYFDRLAAQASPAYAGQPSAESGTLHEYMPTQPHKSDPPEFAAETINHPLSALRNRIADSELRRELLEAQQEAERDVIERDRAEGKDVADQVAKVHRMEGQIANHRTKETLLKDRMFRQLKDQARADEKQAEVNLQKSELAREMHVYNVITNRVARMRTESRAPARVAPLKEATPEDATAAVSVADPKSEQAPKRGRRSQFVETQTALIRSPLVLERVAAQPEIAALPEIQAAKNPVGWLASRLSVRKTDNDDVFRIQFAGSTPEVAAQITNAVVEAYFKVQAVDEVYRTQRVLELLEEERARRQVRIAQLQANLVNLNAEKEGAGGDRYEPIIDIPFIEPKGEAALSTFSIDVDTASYANVRQYLMQQGVLPPPAAVRVEELVNYFDYDYAGPTDETPFASHVEVAGCPWKQGHRLVRVALKGKEVAADDDRPSNLVFLIDVSGSMNDPVKLPLLKDGMKLLAQQVKNNDRVSIVVYAGQEGLALESTPGSQREQIRAVLDDLQPGGSTNGEGGIRLAYKIARDNFLAEGVNRVILCTDGDFNVGVSDTESLKQIVAQQAKSGVFLTVLGFGRGNLNDAMMETISNRGNGNYYYIDSQAEARKVFVDQLRGTLVTIAKDVKIQIEFNPNHVKAYRLIGYENRIMAAEDFNDDKKDAGEIGAGHTVTAFYEIVSADTPAQRPQVDALKYQPNASQERAEPAGDEQAIEAELLTLKLRYKDPDGETSKLLEFPVVDRGGRFARASRDFQFGAAVASFGMVLRGSAHRGDATFDAVREIAANALGEDSHGYRAEFLQLVERARKLSGK
ncbi:MAG: von Willebrand factor type A domain-containing protein [Planctomycetales bacterium]|nr:von Willebrand factor type A domain-containing protein [Planctomycetales bacterium]